MKIQSRLLALISFVSLLFVLACTAGQAAGGAATPTLIALPNVPANGAALSTQAPAAAPTEAAAGSPDATKVYVGTAGAGAPVDLCALATPDEVQAVIGGPVTKTTFDQGGQDCLLSRDDTHLLIVQAGHDADGKVMHFEALKGQRSKITDPSALALLDEISAQQASLTLPQLVEKALPVWRAAGFTAEPEPGIGDWAVWFYGPQLYFGNLAEIGTGRASGAWVAIYTATDEASAKTLLIPLIKTLLDRLPDDFTPSGTGK